MEGMGSFSNNLMRKSEGKPFMNWRLNNIFLASSVRSGLALFKIWRCCHRKIARFTFGWKGCSSKSLKCYSWATIGQNNLRKAGVRCSYESIGTMVSYQRLFFVTILRCVVGTLESYLTCRGHGAREEMELWLNWFLNWTELNLQHRLHTYIHIYTRKQINGTEGQVKVLS